MDALEQFGMTSHRIVRGRGAFICDTNQGIKLLREVNCAEEKFTKEDYITKKLKNIAKVQVDTFCRTNEGSLLAEDDEHKVYYLKDWFDAGECDVRDFGSVMKSIEVVARMHQAFEVIDIGQCENLHIPIAERKTDYYARKYREMQSLRNYLRKKKQKTDFERKIYDSIGPFMREGVETIASINALEYEKAFNVAIERNSLCHGSCTYHNILVGRTVNAAVCFERAQINIPVVDLYDYMRKILEKYDWDIKLAYKMLDEYNRVKTISEQEFLVLGYLFAFPEKYFKILDHYYNSSKAWLPDKDVDKLNTAIWQNEARMRFVSTLK